MDGSEFSQLPPAPQRPNTPARGEQPTQELKARIERVAERLSDVREAKALKAEIVRENRDGSVRVRTAEGEMDVRLPREAAKEVARAANLPRPAPGVKLVVEVQPGQPPTQAVIQPAPQDIDVPAPRVSATPVDVQIRTSGQEALLQTQAQNLTLHITPLLPEALANSLASPEILNTVLPTLMQLTALPVLSEAESIFNVTPPKTQVQPSISILPEGVENIALRPVLKPGEAVLGQDLAPAIKGLSPIESPIETLNKDIFTPLKAEAQQITLSAQNMPPVSDWVHIKAEALPKAETILASPQAGKISAVVSGQTKDGHAVLALPPFSEGGQPLFFTVSETSFAPPVGTVVEITPQTPPAPQIIQNAPPLAGFVQALTPGLWPVMEEILQTLQQQAPALAQAMVRTTANPAQNTAQLPPAALLFVAAVRGGDLTSWLGDKAVDALRRAGKGDLLAKLTQDGGLLGRLASEPMGQDWRALVLPFMNQNEQMQKVALYYKHDEGGEADGDGNGLKQTRFVFDLSLDAMGAVQVDGLFRPGRLDVVLRTEAPIGQAMRADMRQVYAQALHDTQITGELSFQHDPAQWLHIPAPQSEVGVEV